MRASQKYIVVEAINIYHVDVLVGVELVDIVVLFFSLIISELKNEAVGVP